MKEVKEFCCVIMAGGRGTRFWPASTSSRPKQFLPVVGEHPMVRETYRRVEGLVDPSNVVVATGADFVETVEKVLPEVPRDNIIPEPACRDTAPCIALAAFLAARRHPRGVIGVFPSDHVIWPAEVFRDAILKAVDVISGDGSGIYTFGIKPDYPATGYGYIHRGRSCGTGGLPLYEVESFTEKPSEAQARQYLAAGDYYWNSGIYMFRADAVVEAYRTYAPDIAEGVERILESHGTPEWGETLSREYPRLRKISIDYAVSEKAEDIKVFEAPFCWNDVGSWESLRDVREKDDRGNVVVGDGVEMVGSRECIVWNEGEHLVVLMGMDDVAVIHTPRATLVCPVREAQNVKKVVAMLEEKGMKDVL